MSLQLKKTDPKKNKYSVDVMADDTARAWAYLSRVAEPPCQNWAPLKSRL